MPWTVAPQPPSPVPSPPPLATPFLQAVDAHYYFYSSATRRPHRLRANDSSLPSASSSPTRDWRLSFQASFLCNRAASYSLRDLPAELLPFFAYKDVAVYVPTTDEECADLNTLFNAMYREWYPTRDRTIFDDGMFSSCGAPFFASTMRVDFEGLAPQTPYVLKQLVRWHVAMSHHLYCSIPRFDALAQGAMLLVRPGMTQTQLQAFPWRPVLFEYTPNIQPTFTECYIWVERGWEDKGVRLVVLSEDMLHRILSCECEGLTRDVDLEERAQKITSIVADTQQEQREGEEDEHGDIDAEASMDHVSVWRGSLETVMRVVVAGDKGRKRGLRDFNPVLEEWLGEGVNVGKNTESV
ncbi:Nn.00g066570.m01.CDS01 [Neocucurbitaria sp. VM-36]